MSSTLVLAAAAAVSLAPGDRIALVAAKAPEYAVCLTAVSGVLPPLAAGTVLTPSGDGPALMILAAGHRPGDGETPASPFLVAKALAGGCLPVGETAFSPSRSGPAVAWITLSDKGSQGLRTDTAGPAIAEACAARLDPCLIQGHIIPDDPGRLKALLTDLALTQGFDLIVTTGGTGLGPRDTTPRPRWPSSNAACPASKRPC